jgi:nucleoside-triphosphatase
MKRNIIITGLPGVGKTTLIKKVFHEIRSLSPIGFHTEEIREHAIRKGFYLISADSRKSILSHEDIQSQFRVGKYGVDLSGFKHFIGSIPFRDATNNIVIIDEIGKMECFSKMFMGLVIDLLDSDKLVIATVALKGTGLIAHVKSRPDIELTTITKDNRNNLLSKILKHILLSSQS